MTINITMLLLLLQLDTITCYYIYMHYFYFKALYYLKELSIEFFTVSFFELNVRENNLTSGAVDNKKNCYRLIVWCKDVFLICTGCIFFTVQIIY